MSTHQLQVNNDGSWRTVMHFDGYAEETMDAIWQATEVLNEASSSAPNWRIASSGKNPVVHAHMGPHTYGVWIANQEQPK